MRNRILILVKKENRRRLLAAAFLFVFLAEMSSHVIICSDRSLNNESFVSANEAGHDDLCKTMVLCSDGRRKDQQMPNLGHDASQHNALFYRGADFLAQLEFQKDAQSPFSTAHCIFRPPSPPFHPPELS